MTLQKYCMLFIIVFTAFIAGHFACHFIDAQTTNQTVPFSGKTPTTPDSIKKQQLTADKLAKALGIRWFTMTIPPEKQKLHLCLYLKTGNKIQKDTGPQGFFPGEKINVFFWRLKGNELKYCLSGKSVSVSGSIKSHVDSSKGYSTLCELGDGGEIIPGKVFMKFSKKGMSTGPEVKLKPHETGLYFDFYREMLAEPFEPVF